MQYTLEQCLEQQKKVDASIKHNGEYNPIRAARAETVEMQEWLGLIKTWGENKIDMKQAFMELVDTEAFTLSALLLEYCNNIEVISNKLDSHKVLNAEYGIFENIAKDSDCLADCFSLEGFCGGLFNALMLIESICTNHFKRPVADIYHYYMGKQTLTQFRQKNGYKTGGYIKIWHGREDNEYLTEYLEKGLSVEEIENALEIAYSAVVKES